MLHRLLLMTALLLPVEAPARDGAHVAPSTDIPNITMDPEYSAGHDKYHTDFYENLLTPSGNGCCGYLDCHPVRQEDVRIAPDGSLEIRTHRWPHVGETKPPEKIWRRVLPEQILPVPSPDNGVHACTRPFDGSIMCVTLPSNA
jgi:hypothetical protein